MEQKSHRKSTNAAKAIKLYCFKKDMNIKDFSEHVGVSAGIVYNWTCGAKEPSERYRNQIEERTGGAIKASQLTE